MAFALQHILSNGSELTSGNLESSRNVCDLKFNFALLGTMLYINCPHNYVGHNSWRIVITATSMHRISCHCAAFTGPLVRLMYIVRTCMNLTPCRYQRVEYIYLLVHLFVRFIYSFPNQLVQTETVALPYVALNGRLEGVYVQN
jgi:hypothetical protein